MLPAAARMILRNVERKPLRSLFGAIGVAFSVAILVVGLFMFDGVEVMMDLQFRLAERQDLSLTFNQPLSLSVRHDLAHLPGVTRVEPFRAGVLREAARRGAVHRRLLLLGFSGVIATAVIYNGARIALSERGRELASLRVFGFSRGEVAVLLLGEQALVTLLGIPLGWALGYGLAAAVSAGLQTETYRIPLIVKRATSRGRPG